MLNCRQSVLFRICFILLPPDISLIHRAKKFQVLFHRSTEQNRKTSVVYLYDFENFSCAFGSVVVYILEFWHGNCMRLVHALLCKLKPQGFSERAFSEILLQPLKASFFGPIQVV